MACGGWDHPRLVVMIARLGSFGSPLRGFIETSISLATLTSFAKAMVNLAGEHGQVQGGVAFENAVADRRPKGIRNRNTKQENRSPYRDLITNPLSRTFKAVI